MIISMPPSYTIRSVEIDLEKGYRELEERVIGLHCNLVKYVNELDHPTESWDKIENELRRLVRYYVQLKLVRESSFSGRKNALRYDDLKAVLKKMRASLKEIRDDDHVADVVLNGLTVMYRILYGNVSTPLNEEVSRTLRLLFGAENMKPIKAILFGDNHKSKKLKENIKRKYGSITEYVSHCIDSNLERVDKELRRELQDFVKPASKEFIDAIGLRNYRMALKTFLRRLSKERRDIECDVYNEVLENRVNEEWEKVTVEKRREMEMIRGYWNKKGLPEDIFYEIARLVKEEHADFLGLESSVKKKLFEKYNPRVLKIISKEGWSQLVASLTKYNKLDGEISNEKRRLYTKHRNSIHLEDEDIERMRHGYRDIVRNVEQTAKKLERLRRTEQDVNRIVKDEIESHLFRTLFEISPE